MFNITCKECFVEQTAVLKHILSPHRHSKS
jgi:hypothetical protein